MILMKNIMLQDAHIRSSVCYKVIIYLYINAPSNMKDFFLKLGSAIASLAAPAGWSHARQWHVLPLYYSTHVTMHMF